ncbi:unnamed protein product [Calicophoron daubneyi]|uniref:Saposin B-type domain-containing protein n=1 Tax=Calicophoron daubneyi TaxID=300641 RepID=A0AAV2T7F9_CALDB
MDWFSVVTSSLIMLFSIFFILITVPASFSITDLFIFPDHEVEKCTICVRVTQERIEVLSRGVDVSIISETMKEVERRCIQSKLSEKDKITCEVEHKLLTYYKRGIREFHARTLCKDLEYCQNE